MPTESWRMTPGELARFMSKIKVLDNGCWEWTGAVTKPTAKKPGGGGYARYKLVGQDLLGHRVSYQHFVGPIPPNYTIDHLCHGRDKKICAGGPTCRHRRCVNWQHLGATTSQQNTLRGFGPSAANATKTECPAGHPYSDENTYIYKGGRRHCRTCRRSRTNEWYANGGAEWHANYHQQKRRGKG